MKFRLASEDRKRTLLIWTAAGIPGSLTIAFVGYIGAGPLYALILFLAALGVCFEAGRAAWTVRFGQEESFSPSYMSVPVSYPQHAGSHAAVPKHGKHANS